MRARTEELLNVLFWTLDVAFRPSYRNLSASYEEWAYANGFLRQVHELEHRGFLEARGGKPRKPDRLHRLTEKGRLHVLGGRDPAQWWSRPWDGKWRLVLFDIPEDERSRRLHLRRYLRSRAFGCLQNSVWITPDPLEPESDVLRGGRVNVESLILLEGTAVAGERNEDIVEGAWDFRLIRRRYEKVVAVLERRPRGPLRSREAGEALSRWAREERAAWQEVVAVDPFLPRSLWPPGYPGEKVWKRRCAELRSAGRLVAGFRPPDG